MTPDRATAPIESLCERDGWWRAIDADTFAICADPATDRWCVWRRIESNRTHARRDPGDHQGADAAARAARSAA